MKKSFIIMLLLVLTCLSVNAKDLRKPPFKNLKDNAKITLQNDLWSNKTNRKTDIYYIKKGAEFYTKDDSLAFTADSPYLFIKNGKLIGYSNSDLKFYEYKINNEIFEKTELNSEEVKNIFPKYKIILITDFSTSTNSLKIKKHIGKLKTIVLNNTDREFNNYTFTTGNSKFECCPLVGFINIKKRGMIQFSRFGDNTKNSPWFILLVR